MKINILGIFLFLASIASAQFSPVNWSYASEKAGDGEYVLTFTAEIEEGWYVYSQYLEDGGPIPTEFVFTDQEGLEMNGKTKETGLDKKESFDDLFDMKLIKYGSKVKFMQNIKVDSSVKTVKGFLTFMTCNDESCLPPKDIDFEFDLN